MSSSIKLYRYTVDGQGVFDYLKNALSQEEWHVIKDCSSWLPNPSIEYKQGYKSYFTELGNAIFLTHDEIFRYIKPKLTIREFSPQNIVYQDVYQVVYNESILQ